jgi:hypothetical protein
MHLLSLEMKMGLDFNFMTTLIGSFPHREPDQLIEKILASADIPAWPQLPRRNFRESIYIQYSTSLPCTVLDPLAGKISFDTRGDVTPALERFYEAYLAGDLEAFALQPDFAAGFYAMLTALASAPGLWCKGHVMGPISFGLTVTDQNLRAGLYDEQLADVIVKNMAMQARWQVRQLKAVRTNVILFVDEPYMASFGSAFIAVNREQAIANMDEVFQAIHAEGGLAGVHCCGNTDWSVLMDTQVDILNLDAQSHIENLSLYPAALRRFLNRGGSVAWGILPNDSKALEATPQGIATALVQGLNLVVRRAETQNVAISLDEFASRSLLTPACGLGSTDEIVASRVLELLASTRQAVLEQIA